jgi:sulfofructose kinase
VLDAGSLTPATRALAAEADHLVASRRYAREALGAEPANASATALRGLAGRPGATVIVTLGAEGLRWADAVDQGNIPAQSIKTVDTNGAGDAFHGAYALALARRLPLAARLRIAAAAGALACTLPGSAAALPRAADLAAFLRSSA